ncbi:transglutaminase family protein [Sphingobium rhizovicinum]|uniref:Transglutaminase family protein n=1 Tax=Sphingobium rhizovicinum TaxID=432308 RepID=A0ABV7NNP1_9SPHN
MSRDIKLDSAALALSSLDHAGQDIELYLEQLRQISDAVEAARKQRVATDLASGEGQGALIAKVIGEQLGFVGDSDSYDAPLNADMIRVLDRRRGLPVSLSILYVAAARRMGWRADALKTPSHALVSIGPTDAPTLIDPFNGGRLVLPEQLLALLEQVSDAGGWPSETHVAPMSNRMTLVRLLLNQVSRAEQAGDTLRARALYERMTVMAPDHGAGWWEFACLQLVHREVDKARASLGAMLEVTRDIERRAHIHAALARLTTGD